MHFTFLGREEEILTKLKSSTMFTIEDSESHEIQGANSAESKATNVFRNNKKGLMNRIVANKSSKSRLVPVVLIYISFPLSAVITFCLFVVCSL